MANKVWTAVDLKQGSLTITPRLDNILHVHRRYDFLDSDGNVISQIKTGRLVEDIAIADVPTDILAALATINTWTKNKALEQEGMNE